MSPKLAVFFSNDVVGLEGHFWQGNATVKLDGCFLSGLRVSSQVVNSYISVGFQSLRYMAGISWNSLIL